MPTSYEDFFSSASKAASFIPSNIRFGTSSWAYPGWQGLVYQKSYSSKSSFSKNSLEEYASIPLFRTIGIDSFFYNPATVQKLRTIDSQTPEDFIFVSKAWERITIAKYPNLKRYGKLAGNENQDFLNSTLFTSAVLEPVAESGIKSFGPIVLQFPSLEDYSSKEFLEKLHQFLLAIPKSFQYCMEIRNPEFLNKEYFQVLNEFKVAHCFNHWTGMPDLREQAKKAAIVGGIKADYFVARILTPQGLTYSDSVKKFQPYKQLKQRNLRMREQIQMLIRRACSRNMTAFIIVNNRSEGCAPLSILELAQELRVS